MTKNSIDYDVDSNFNLIWKKNVKFVMDMKLSRPSQDAASGAKTDVLDTGDYLLRWAIVDRSVDLNTTPADKVPGNKILGTGEQQFTVNSASTLQGDMTITLRNLKSIGNNNSIFLEVTPPEKTASAAASVVTFTGMIALSDDATMGTLSPMKGIHNIIPKLTQSLNAFQQSDFNQQKRRATKENFAKEMGLQLANLNQTALFDGVPVAATASWIESGNLSKTVSAGICAYWVKHVLGGASNDESDYGAFKMPTPKWFAVSDVPFVPSSPKEVNSDWQTACENKMQKQPSQMFSIDYQHFTDQGSLFPMQAPQKATQDAGVRSLTLSDSFSLSHSNSVADSFRKGWTVSATANAGLNLGLGDPSGHSPVYAGGGTGIGGGYEISQMHSDTTTDSTGSSITVTAGQPLEIRTVDILIHANNFEKCAVLRLNPNLLFGKDPDGFLDPHMSAVKRMQIAATGLLVCPGFKAGHPEHFAERYYTIAPPAQSSGTTDGQSASARSLFVSIRGRAGLARFLSAINRNYQIPQAFMPDYTDLHSGLQPLFMTDWLPFPANIVSSR